MILRILWLIVTFWQVVWLPVYAEVGLLFVTHILAENRLPSTLRSKKHLLETVFRHWFLYLELIWPFHLILLSDKMLTILKTTWKDSNKDVLVQIIRLRVCLSLTFATRIRDGYGHNIFSRRLLRLNRILKLLLLIHHVLLLQLLKQRCHHVLLLIIALTQHIGCLIVLHVWWPRWIKGLICLLLRRMLKCRSRLEGGTSGLKWWVSLLTSSGVFIH